MKKNPDFVILSPLMQIKYFGHASFYLKTKAARIVTDPFDSKMVGLKFPKTEVDIVTVSHGHADHNFLGQVSGDPLVIDWPGEFEKNDVRVTGYPTYHDKEKGAQRGENILYKIEAEEISLLHCGDLGWTLDDETVDQIGEIDILFVPVGGHFTIDANEAQEVAKKIEPSIVVPMHYGNPEMAPDLLKLLAPLAEFLNKFGVSEKDAVDQLTIKKEDLVAEEMKVIPLQVNP